MDMEIADGEQLQASTPRYASTTRGSRRTSAGAPSAILIMVENDHTVPNVHEQTHVVLNQDNGNAIRSDPADETVQVRRLGRVHSSNGFIEEQKLGACHQGPRDLDTPLQAVRQRSRRYSRLSPQANITNDLLRVVQRFALPIFLPSASAATVASTLA